MLLRSTSVLGAAALLVLPLAGTAAASTTKTTPCDRLLRTAVLKGVGPALPYVLAQDGADGTGTSVIVMDSVGGGTTGTITSCLFHDRDRDGRQDDGEPLRTHRSTTTVDPEDLFAKVSHSFFLDGVGEGERVCNWRSVRSVPLAGGRTTTRTTELTCYDIVWS